MGRRKKSDLEESVNAVEQPKKEQEKLEPEVKVESPQSVQRRAAAKQAADAKKNNKAIETYFECRGDKVCKVVKKQNGNKYRTYHLNRSKDKASYASLEAELKAKGQSIRHV